MMWRAVIINKQQQRHVVGRALWPSGDSSSTLNQFCRYLSSRKVPTRRTVGIDDKSAKSGGGLTGSFGAAPEDRPYLHHGTRPRYRNNNNMKFKSPRGRATKLLSELTAEAIDKSKARNPLAWETKYVVGDAIEIEMVDEGSVADSDITEKIRGIVIGIINKGLDTSIILRDVIFGETVERRILLHQPTIRSIKLLETNFIYKGKRKVKKSKLYYLRDKNPLISKVSKGK